VLTKLYDGIEGLLFVAVNDTDTETWGDVPTDCVLIDKTTCKIRTSQYKTVVDALRKECQDNEHGCNKRTD
jgi:hypothetical protein